MIRFNISGVLALALLLGCLPRGVAAADKPHVLFETSKGNIELELYPDKAPVTVANFLAYVKRGFYDGTVFHRTVYQWIIQGGGYDVEYSPRDTDPPIKNEAGNGLKNTRGTIAMARTWEPDSADSQFFVNLIDNPTFDHRNDTKRGFGYCVFGRVVAGLEIADAIGDVETHELEDFGASVPVEPVVLIRATLQSAETPAGQ